MPTSLLHPTLLSAFLIRCVHLIDEGHRISRKDILLHVEAHSLIECIEEQCNTAFDFLSASQRAALNDRLAETEVVGTISLHDDMGLLVVVELGCVLLQTGRYDRSIV